MAGKPAAVGPKRGGVDDDLVPGIGEFAVHNFEFASKIGEPTTVVTGNFRSGEINGGRLGSKRIRLGLDRFPR